MGIKILTSQQTGETDNHTITHEPIASINLMERAAHQAYRWISEHFPTSAFSVFAGPGNNGGDALAIARMLINKGHRVKTYLYRRENLSPDAQINLERLQQIPEIFITDLSKEELPASVEPKAVAIDGLFGSGLNRPLNDKAAKIVTHINSSFTKIISIDVPSGLFCEDNSNNQRGNIVKATFTLTFQMPKLAFLFPENRDFTGDWSVLPIGLSRQKIAKTSTPWSIATPKEIRKILPPPHRFAHKGTMGHALLIAGSYGKTGAALLASRACLKSGVGLLTTHVPHSAVSILQTAIPEAMMSVDRSDLMFTEHPDLKQFQAIGIGPGLGTRVNTQRALRELLEADGEKRMVLDADALNILSADPELLRLLPTNAILTPHPKEFERLAGESDNEFLRLQKAIEFAGRHQVVLILKGAFTAVISPEGIVSFNPTGNPGMATAGSGDTLTGIILGLLASGIAPLDAARAAVYIHGLAGDLAARNGMRGLIASDIIDHLQEAFRDVSE
ncbi:NAD(P)H-hydrate dehydratase [Marinilabilia salmonicolor]|jgi:NAD(P)H-hydrate epimerase|uniref:Bifunctional NAD(P)H-hydrate repair enzyme n=1 Tax=Marinilabilia salmonicolor TaxID=989 RepID=A0A2T0XP34_9BACT|nr:NAD(P)H-hydrate dehydratase [Marinilabilia salmonicolor]PRZ00715.1 NAD(P)H-hydrate epimerase [Marinilabilia salmonicolor]RCW27004.1 NAD(P)H-hydrate epimerase [Marinilabilia salmonicolor]